ncbi:uncharacterized protein ATC70_005002 [Mucor velutinosus]|uniref:Putative zinc-finger domain-containing protein n=1 Tax=Mucor velutinosus TaxID=708070 RepID=A0AAN7D4C3_9FUNG|nr:hypothetical protein ATC70_005002 [Mucor velutinosus]
MSQANGISYGVRPEDDGSDMDVSSDDEGLYMYEPLPSDPQEQIQCSKQDQLQHDSREQQQPLSTPSGSKSSSSRLTTITNCWTTFVDKVAQHQAPIATRDGASDTESTSSFYTAPNSPIDLTLDDDQGADMDRQQATDIINELVSEQDKLTQELERITNEEKRIASLIEAKKAKLEAVRVRQLELQVRKSIQKNRKAVVTPVKSKKGKEKASLDKQFRSYSSSDEEDTQQRPRKAKAVMDPTSGRPERRPVEEPARAEPNVEFVKEQEAQVETKEDVVKKTDENQTQRDAVIAEREKVSSLIAASNKPCIANIAKQNKSTLQAIRRSQKLGNTSVGQMKMFLCDLYDKFLEDGTLSRVQKVHYKELVRQVSRYDAFGDDHIPGRATPKKAKKLERKVQPEKYHMLPNEFYGHPKKLDFRNLKVDRRKLLDALSCPQIESPFILGKARKLLAKGPTELKLSDFEGVIGPDGKVIDKEELRMHMANRKINRLLALYQEVKSNAYLAAPMSMGQRTRHEYDMAQRRLEESVMRETGTISPEPSTTENPLVSDNSTATLNPVMVSLAPSSKAVESKPITTITYVPTETSFIRSILPGGREPTNSIKQPKTAQKAKASQQSKLPPPPKASKASNAKPVSLPKAPTKSSTQASASVQIPTIPKNFSPSGLSDNLSLSAPNTPSSSPTLSTTNTNTIHPQPSASQTPPPQQNTSSTFQPYRSALNSLGVTRSVDVRPVKSGILCRAESNGGVCNDKSCCDMHFTDFINK